MAPFDQTLPRSARAAVLHYPRDVAESVEVLIVSETVPAYAHPGDAGADLTAAVAVELAPGERATVGTGVAIALPDGFVAFVVPRSGLASKHGITIVNSPGTVDAGYRGEISVTLLNTDSSVPYSVAVGDRIAQLVIMPVTRARFIPVETLPGSQRGDSGFGSSGYGSTGHRSTGHRSTGHRSTGHGDPTTRDNQQGELQ
jgi:dUTP pyrophosphatase